MHSRITPKPSLRRLAATVALASVGLVACGGGDDNSGAPADEQADEQTDEQTDVQTDVQTDEQAEGGGDADLPDEFPRDMVPLPDDAEIVTTSTVDSGDGVAYTLLYTTSKSVDDVADYYGDELDSSWHEVMKTTSDGGLFLAFATESDGTGDGVQISAGPANDGTDQTTVSVIVILNR